MFPVSSLLICYMCCYTCWRVRMQIAQSVCDPRRGQKHPRDADSEEALREQCQIDEAKRTQHCRENEVRTSTKPYVCVFVFEATRVSIVIRA